MYTWQKGDLLQAMNVDDCEEGLLLGDICILEETLYYNKSFILVTLPNGKLRQLEMKRFARIF